MNHKLMTEIKLEIKIPEINTSLFLDRHHVHVLMPVS